MSVQRLMTLMLACWIMSPAVMAAYKCEKEENGKKIIEYSQLPKQGYNCIDMQHGPAPSHDPEAEMQKLRDKVDDVSGSSGTTDAAKRRAAKRAENCEVAKSNLEILESDQEVVRTDEDGNKVLMGENERVEAVEEARENVRLFCNP